MINKNIYNYDYYYPTKNIKLNTTKIMDVCFNNIINYKFKIIVFKKVVIN